MKRSKKVRLKMSEGMKKYWKRRKEAELAKHLYTPWMNLVPKIIRKPIEWISNEFK